MADQFCGEGTKLIFYMEPGEVLSRTLTSKDTHGTNGKLLVPFTELERIDEGNMKRVKATSAILGFGSPSFSYGTDLILPAYVNQQLRSFLLSGRETQSGAERGEGEQELQLQRRGDEANTDLGDGEKAVRLIVEFEGAFVPEVRG